MKSIRFLIFGLLTIVFLFVYLSLVSRTFAQTATSESPLKTRVEAKKERVEVRKAKLDANRLRACEVKEKVLTNRITSLTRMTANMLEKFNNIATRVKEFYTSKLLSNGKTVADYDSLVADIDAAAANVDTALTNAKTNAESFTCDSNDPKGTLTGFKEDMQAVKSALKDYRTSIKNLIVAVKTAAGGQTSE